MTDSSFSSAPHFDSRSIKEKDYSRKKKQESLAKLQTWQYPCLGCDISFALSSGFEVVSGCVGEMR
jgi:hypothetical protein